MDDYENREQDRHDARMARLDKEKDIHDSLLAALEQLVADWDNVDQLAQVPNEINNDTHWSAARAAIAKAKA